MIPQATGLVDAGPSFYAPQSFTDEAGRRVMIGWLRERRSGEEQVADGWSGAMTLPRILGIAEDGTLESSAAPEITNLRSDHTSVTQADLDPEGVVTTVRGDAIEIMARFGPGSSTVGTRVRRTDDASEFVDVTIDRSASLLILDTTHGSLNPNTKGIRTETPIAISREEAVTIRTFVDRSVIEVFVNDTIAISDRVYPVSHHADGVAIIGQQALTSLDIWSMTSL